MQLQGSPTHPHAQGPLLLPRVRGRQPLGRHTEAREGKLPSLCTQGMVQVSHAETHAQSALSTSGLKRSHVKQMSLFVSCAFRCLHCEMVFKTVQGQKNHIEEKHCVVLYKCSSCPVAFKSSDGCEIHMKNKHNVSETSAQ